MLIIRHHKNQTRFSNIFIFNKNQIIMYNIVFYIYQHNYENWIKLNYIFILFKKNIYMAIQMWY